MILRYDSASHIRADFIAHKCERSATRNSWYGNETTGESLHKLQYGDTTLVPAAEALLDQLETGIETTRPTWQRNVAGAYASVPDVLAGLPTPMRRLQHTPDEKAPITIFSDTGSSAAVAAATLTKRGIVILALVMALARTRPVTLFQLDCGSGTRDGETVLATKIDTTPLDLATACYLLTSPGFSRGIVYPLEAAINGHSGGWPKGFSFADPEPYYAKLKPKLTADVDRCLIIPAARSNDLLLSQPLVWIDQQIKRFITSTEEAMP